MVRVHVKTGHCLSSNARFQMIVSCPSRRGVVTNSPLWRGGCEADGVVTPRWAFRFAQARCSSRLGMFARCFWFTVPLRGICPRFFALWCMEEAGERASGGLRE